MNPIRTTLATHEEVHLGPGRAAQGRKRLPPRTPAKSRSDRPQISFSVLEEEKEFIDKSRKEMAPEQSMREFFISLIEYHKSTAAAPQASGSFTNIEERLARLEKNLIDATAAIAGLVQAVEVSRHEQLKLGGQILQRAEKSAERQADLTTMMDEVEGVLLENLEAERARVNIFNSFNQNLQRLLSASDRPLTGGVVYRGTGKPTDK